MFESVIQRLALPLALQCYANDIDPVKEGLLVEGDDFDHHEELEAFKQMGEKMKLMTKIARKLHAQNKQEMLKELKHAGFCGADALKIVARMDCNVFTLNENG